MKNNPKRDYRYHCSLCSNKLSAKSKTAAGKKRWKCAPCGYSTTKPRHDLSRKFVFEKFLAWLLGKNTQHELSSPARTFRSQIEWCWDVPVPMTVSGEIHHCIIIDGIKVGTRVCLIARTVYFVIAWVWVPYESSQYWSLLLGTIPEPDYAVCDGQKGMLKAIAACWPSTIVQRCRFHVWLNIKSKLTLNPVSGAGRDLLQLTRALLRVRSRRQARRWKQQLKYWHKKHQAYINERTYKDNLKPRERKWRYTHERLRSAYRQLNKHADDVLRSSYRSHSELPATTNHIEGGINSQIRTLLKQHRGMPQAHQEKLTDWYLYSRSEQA